MSEGATPASSSAWRIASFGPLEIGIDHVLGIGGHAEALDLRQDPGAARAGVLQLLHDQHARALAEHRAVALLGEGEAAVGREHAHGLPGLHGAVVDGGLRRAGNADIDGAVADEPVHQADGMRGGGAGADRAEGRALDAVVDADVGRRRAADELQEQQRIAGPAFLVNS